MILDRSRCPEGIRDSKVLSPAARARLAEAIAGAAVAWAVGEADAGEIDAANILVATKRAMLRALAALPVRPDFLIVDALPLSEAGIPMECPVKADRDVMSVAAASILAKVHRDRRLEHLDAAYPGYGLARHKGYGTQAHLEALALLGPSPIHRRTFARVQPGLAGLDARSPIGAAAAMKDGVRPSLPAKARGPVARRGPRP